MTADILTYTLKTISEDNTLSLRYTYDFAFGILVLGAMIILVKLLIERIVRKDDFYWDITKFKVLKFLKSKGFDYNKEVAMQEAYMKMLAEKDIQDELEALAFQDIIRKSKEQNETLYVKKRRK